MKHNKILTITLAIVLTLSLTAPVLAEEGDAVLPAEDAVTGQAPADDTELPPEIITDPLTPPADGAEPPPEELDTIQPPDAAEQPGDSEDHAPDQPAGDAEAPADGEDDPAEEEPEEGAGETPDLNEDPPAQEDDAGELDFEETEPLINVAVPPNSQVVVNPYRMRISTAYGESTDQIVHEPQVLISNSDIPLTVAVHAVGILPYGSAAQFTVSPPPVNAVDKEIFLYVEFQDDPAFWSGSYTDGTNQILVTDRGVQKADVMMLNARSAGYFRLFGDMTNFPHPMWGEEDTPDVTLTFTFTPLEALREVDLLPEEALPDAVLPELLLPVEPLPEETIPGEKLPEIPSANEGFSLPEDIPAENV